MFQLRDYYTLTDANLSFTKDQSSLFAKQVAGDFNPIHDPDHKRFCVPGDLLFSVFLTEYGVHQKMCFTFAGMVNDTTSLNLLKTDSEQVDITNDAGKKFLSVERSGNSSQDQTLIQNIACRYVQFSGHTFPHILVPLMSDKHVMINPDRPLVIYEKMSISLDRLDLNEVQLEETQSHLEVSGKRGKVTLEFCFKSDGDIIGHGQKTMLLSGLREYNADSMQSVVDHYHARKSAVATR